MTSCTLFYLLELKLVPPPLLHTLELKLVNNVLLHTGNVTNARKFEAPAENFTVRKSGKRIRNGGGFL